MKRSTDKSQSSWSDVKRQLTDWDRTALLGLVGDLYGFSKDNQAFLHARLQLGDDPLRPYKEAIARWVYPDLFAKQEYSVAKAKKAISDFRKACGHETDLLELMIFATRGNERPDSETCSDTRAQTECEPQRGCRAGLMEPWPGP